MKPFINDEFMLENQIASRLYHKHAEKMPIYDYHCHLNPMEIAQNKRYRNLTELWLGGDHYKWRAMRINGIEEKYITGNAPEKEKFLKWAETVPYCIGNPLYHWTHLELKRYFGIDQLLSPETAEVIWVKCNEMLKTEEFSVRGLIKRSNVKIICTTDNPVDTLEYHTAIANDNEFDVRVLPAFRPDIAIYLERVGFRAWIEKLGSVSGISIQNLDDLKTAIKQRMDHFHRMGCRISDHALDPIVYRKGTEAEADLAFRHIMEGKTISTEQIEKYQTYIMEFLGFQYSRMRWTMQLHLGTIRNTNKKMLAMLGPDTGFDSIGDRSFAEALVKLLNGLEEADSLPRTILYCLNPRDNEVLATAAGCFQGDGIPEKIQFGSGWWFNDQKDGMVRQLTALSNLGLLSRFIGMLTDSRSFLSYTRHEYFRRILCSMIGVGVEKGEMPGDMDHLGKMVEDICFNNAGNYFGIEMT
jgi:Glucuronate isomerase